MPNILFCFIIWDSVLKCRSDPSGILYVCSSCWPQTKRSARHCLLSASIKGGSQMIGLWIYATSPCLVASSQTPLPLGNCVWHFYPSMCSFCASFIICLNVLYPVLSFPLSFFPCSLHHYLPPVLSRAEVTRVCQGALHIIFLFVFVSWDRVTLYCFGICCGASPCRPGWTPTYRDPHSSSSQVLEVKDCATKAGFAVSFLNTNSQAIKKRTLCGGRTGWWSLWG